jgi:cell shape-determining protein MreC
MAQGITIDGSKDIDQYAYLVTEVLPDNIANIEQKLADNAKTESAIRESDYNFKDLVALIYSSKAYTEQTLPLEFVAKLEQSIEKLGYVSGETYGKVQTELEGVKTELAGAKIQIAELTEINETLREENRELNCRVLELVSINENVNHIPQKEMTGLSPKIQKLTELNEKPDMAELPEMIEKAKEIIGIGEKQKSERGGGER